MANSNQQNAAQVSFASESELMKKLLEEAVRSDAEAIKAFGMHQAYHPNASGYDYVTRGSKLVCSLGTKPSRIDLPLDYGVVIDEDTPVLTCIDAKAGTNLHSFGTCPNTPNGACVPTPTGPWAGTSAEGIASIYVADSNTYETGLTMDKAVACGYAGMIAVVEAYNQSALGELEWIPTSIMQISGQSQQEKNLDIRIKALNATIEGSKRTRSEKDKLKWDQDKVDIIWEVCREFYLDYKVQVDPRILVSIICKEGTGSFNTNWVDKAGDGGNGAQLNFQNDVENAIDIIGGKAIVYPYFKDAFSQARADAYAKGIPGFTDKDDILHYFNWITPRLQLISNGFDCNLYAEDTTWHRGIRLIYSEIAYENAPAEYSNYVISLGKGKAEEIAATEGITIKGVTFKAEANKNGSYSIVGTTV